MTFGVILDKDHSSLFKKLSLYCIKVNCIWSDTDRVNSRRFFVLYSESFRIENAENDAIKHHKEWMDSRKSYLNKHLSASIQEIFHQIKSVELIEWNKKRYKCQSFTFMICSLAHQNWANPILYRLYNSSQLKNPDVSGALYTLGIQY